MNRLFWSFLALTASNTVLQAARPHTVPGEYRKNYNLSKKVSIRSAAILSTQQILPVVVTSPAPIKMTTAQIMGFTPATAACVPTLPHISSFKAGGSPVNKQFTISDYRETGQYGPSADAGVGSTQVMLGSKGRVRTMCKATGLIDNILNVSHDRFFSCVSLGGFTADPNIIFDPHSQRWFLFCDGGFPFLLLAMSGDETGNGDPITLATTWNFFIIDSTTPNPGFDAAIPYFDYTTLGLDKNALYCACNVYDESNPYYESSAEYVVIKSSLIAGQPQIFAFRNLINQTTSVGPFTPQGALNFDTNPTNTNGYFISQNLYDVENNSLTTLILDTVTFNTSGVPSITEQAIQVTPYVGPLFAPALGTPKPLFDPGVRLCPAHIRNGLLRVVNEIGVDNTGTSTPSAVVTRNGARFYEIDITQPTPVVRNQGTLFQASAANDVNQRCFITPSIMSNASGQIIISATTCGAQERLNTSITYVVNSTPGQPTLYTSSTSNYFATEDWEFSPNSRWGDHTRISLDPVDQQTFWAAGLWCNATNSWATQIGQVPATAGLLKR